MKPILVIFIFIFSVLRSIGHRQTTKSTNSTHCPINKRLSTLSTLSIVYVRPIEPGSVHDLGALEKPLIRIDTTRASSAKPRRAGWAFQRMRAIGTRTTVPTTRLERSFNMSLIVADGWRQADGGANLGRATIQDRAPRHLLSCGGIGGGGWVNLWRCVIGDRTLPFLCSAAKWIGVGGKWLAGNLLVTLTVYAGRASCRY